MERYKWNFTYMAIGGLFFVFALITLLASVKEFKSWKEFKETAVPVAARITDIESYTDDDETKHRVFIEYEYEGERYSDKLSYYITGMKKGDTVEIYVDPDAPSYSQSHSVLLSVLSWVLMLAFGGIGVGLMGHELKRSIYINRLIDEDKYVYAYYSNEEKSGYSVNEVEYNCSVFVYKDDSGNERRVKSEPYPPDANPYATGYRVKVYVDIEKTPEKYYVSREK